MTRPSRRHLKVGELERSLGVTRDQVHHYVEIGLVPPPDKSASTLAWYGPTHQRAIARVRAAREAGASLAQAQRWFTGALADLGPDDARTLTRWVLGPGGRSALPLGAMVAAIESQLAAAAPEALVAGSPVDPAAWMTELAARWSECEEQARVELAREAVTAAHAARLARWWPIDGARVEGGVLRAAALDAQGARDGDVRARLASMLPEVAHTPGAELGRGHWGAVARAMASMRARRWASATDALQGVAAGAPGAELAGLLRWCVDAMSAARGGDGVLAMVPRLAELRRIDPSTVSDRVERLRLRWTLAVTWAALPRRWAGDQPRHQLDAILDELREVPGGDVERATGELDVIEANALLLRAPERVAPFGGAVAVEASKRLRRAARAV